MIGRTQNSAKHIDFLDRALHACDFYVVFELKRSKKNYQKSCTDV
jgi:hypothetical protein